nr:MAG TPA: hypothetical protein [Bacteriophage sp.]
MSIIYFIRIIYLSNFRTIYITLIITYISILSS